MIPAGGGPVKRPAGRGCAGPRGAGVRRWGAGVGWRAGRGRATRHRPRGSRVISPPPRCCRVGCGHESSTPRAALRPRGKLTRSRSGPSKTRATCGASQSAVRAGRRPCPDPGACCGGGARGATTRASRVSGGGRRRGRATRHRPRGSRVISPPPRCCRVGCGHESSTPRAALRPRGKLTRSRSGPSKTRGHLWRVAERRPGRAEALPGPRSVLRRGGQGCRRGQAGCPVAGAAGPGDAPQASRVACDLTPSAVLPRGVRTRVQHPPRRLAAAGQADPLPLGPLEDSGPPVARRRAPSGQGGGPARTRSVLRRGGQGCNDAGKPGVRWRVAAGVGRRATGLAGRV